MAAKLTEDDVRSMAKAIELNIPESDLPAVALRLSSFLEVIADIDAQLGDEMDNVDPIPPVFPREDF